MATTGTTIRRVRAEPGGSVRLTFTEQGWTVTRESGPSLDTEQWLGVGMLVFLVAADASNPLGVRWLTFTQLGIAGQFLLALLMMVLVQFVGTGFAGSTTVELTMADGSTQRYASWRSRRALAAAFG